MDYDCIFTASIAVYESKVVVVVVAVVLVVTY